MSSSPRVTVPPARLIAAFLAGQAVMLGLVCLLRPQAASADPPPTPVVNEVEALRVRNIVDGSSIALQSVGREGGPSITFTDAKGKARLQMSVNASGRPVILMRDKTDKIALALGLENDQPTVAVRNEKDVMVPLVLPKEEPEVTAPVKKP